MWTYDATLVRVIDGDTVCLRLEKHVSLEVDFGFYIKESVVSHKSVQLNFRLNGINTPEIIGATGETREKGLAAKAEVERLLGLGPIRATTFKPDKYGRWLVVLVVTLPDGSEMNVNDTLVETGFAVPYMV